MGMYNLKNIILGFGLGLVLASLININVNSRDVTIDFIKSEALKKGLILIDPKDVINKNIDFTDVNSNNYGDKKDNVVEIIVEEGSDCHKVADVLFNNELIKDKKEFINYLYERKKTENIQYGIFFIKEGSNMEEIANIITNANGKIKPNN